MKKKFTPIIILLLILSSCCVDHESRKYLRFPKYKFGVTIYGGEGMDSGYSTVFCDSVQMSGLLRAELWIDGTKMNVVADSRISVWSNPDFLSQATQ